MRKGPSLLVRFTIYPIIGAIFLTIAFVVMLLAFGYDVGYENGKFVTNRTGIIIVSTQPGDAEVYVDGELYEKRTASLPLFTLKLNRMRPGDYEVRVVKDGYIPWNGIINVEPGLVSWLDYLILIPFEKEAVPYNFPGTVKQTVNSSDKGLLLVKTVDEELGIATIWSINTSSKAQTKIQELKMAEKGDINLLSISAGNSRYLYQEIVGESKSYKVREIKENGQSWDISGQFGVTYDQIVFSPYSHDGLYVLRENNLYNINYVGRSMGASLAKDVVGIYPNESELLMVQKTNESHGLWRVTSGGEIQNVIKAIPASKSYGVSLLRNPRTYVIYAKDEKDLLVYRNEAQNPTLETIARDVDSYSVAPSEKKIGYATGGGYMVYDIHNEKYFIALKNKEIGNINWFGDSANLLYLEKDQLRMVNYTGYYDQPLFEALGQTPVITSSSNNNIYFSSEATEKDLDIFVYSF